MKWLKKIAYAFLLFLVVDLILVIAYFNYAKNWVQEHQTCQQNYQTGLVFFHSLDQVDSLLSAGSIYRLEAALKLYQEKKIQQFIVAGGNRQKKDYDLAPKPSGSTLMAKWLIKQGIPTEKITIDSCSYDTFSNIENALTLRKIHSLGSFTCISSTQHLFRIQHILQTRKVEAGICSIGNEKISWIELIFGVHQEWISFSLMALLDNDTYIEFIRKLRKVENFDCN